MVKALVAISLTIVSRALTAQINLHRSQCFLSFTLDKLTFKYIICISWDNLIKALKETHTFSSRYMLKVFNLVQNFSELTLRNSLKLMNN